MEETKMLPAIKVYNIDYDFIIKNYTDPKLWDEKWVLLTYKNNIFTLALDSINVKKKSIWFELRLQTDLDIYSNSGARSLQYNIGNMNIDFLKSEINSVMKRLVNDIEESYISIKDEDYLYVENNNQSERDNLREIAEEFLDEQGVTNDEIREIYIDYYVDENDKLSDYLSNIKDKKKYNYLTELWLILAETTNDMYLKEKILNNQDNDISTLLEEIEEQVSYMETEDYNEEMQGNLESL